MSASYRDRDGFLYWDRNLDSFQEVIIESTFDAQVDNDEYEIQEILREEKRLRKVCLFKIFTFFPDYFFSRLILGEDAAFYKKQAGKLYWNYYRKKISIEKFKKDLTSILNKGIIV